MTNRTPNMKIALCAVAAAITASALAPTVASAQAYGQPTYRGGAYDNNGYYYDPCRRSTTNRGTGGGLAGAGLGAAIGGSVSGNGAKTEGAVLGGLLGAVIGSNIGKNSAACTPGATPPPPPPPSAYNTYDNDRYADRDDGRYDDSRYGDVRRDADRDAYRRDSYSYRVEQRSSTDINGCTLAESPIYLPDGRVQKRFVRVCPDANGKYQVVD
jgi:hypothetical protein